MIVSQLALSSGTPACAACFSTSLSCSISSIGANNSPGCLVILSSLTSAFAVAVASQSAMPTINPYLKDMHDLSQRMLVAPKRMARMEGQRSWSKRAVMNEHRDPKSIEGNTLTEHHSTTRQHRHVGHFFSMFQKATLEATSTPSMFLRKATGCRYCPRTTWVGYSEARTLTASAMDFCLAGSVSLAKASRRRSNSRSHGQPNVAFSQLALRKLVATGSSTSTPPQEVR